MSEKPAAGPWMRLEDAPWVCECGALLRVAEIRATPMGVIVIYHRCTCGGVREWVRRLWRGGNEG